MDRERIKFFREDQQEKILEWVKDLEPSVAKYPFLEKVDLVVEGGRGNGITMAHIARCLFPNALYVGTEISREHAEGYRRIWQGNKIKKEALQKILRADEFPDLRMEGAVIYGNCFNSRLIRSIAGATNRLIVFLVSMNAINALVDRDINRDEGKKDPEDFYTVEEIVGKKSPYIGQLHVINGSVSWDEGEPTCIEYNFHRLEDAGIATGWGSERLSEGLLLVRSGLLEKAA